MRIGLLVAIEMDSVFAHYPETERLPSPDGFELFRTTSGKNDIFILHAGMGEIAASCGVQYLVTACKVDLIVNFGVVGGLTAEMKTSKVCVVERVVHYKYDCSEFMDLKIGQVAGHDSIYLPTDASLSAKVSEIIPGIKHVTCCSGDKFVGTEAEKRSLHETFGGDVCDMESAGIVLAAEINRVPCLLLKAVSDGLIGGAREFYDELLDVSTDCLRAADTVIAQL